MRMKFIAGNWKMNYGFFEAEELIKNLIAKENEIDFTKKVVAICPPFTLSLLASNIMEDSAIYLGAQNCHFEPKGAFTGEVSVPQLKEIGIVFIIIGHSERRTYFGETDEIINKKIKAIIAEGLNPIFCIGETLDERNSNKTYEVLDRQIRKGLEGVAKQDVSDTLTIAYEPVWAIGTGITATSEQIASAHKFIRELIAELYDQETADNVLIQYGGSVNEKNANEILNLPNVDGALVGGASLKADTFLQIVNAC